MSKSLFFFNCQEIKNKLALLFFFDYRVNWLIWILTCFIFWGTEEIQLCWNLNFFKGPTVCQQRSKFTLRWWWLCGSQVWICLESHNRHWFRNQNNSGINYRHTLPSLEHATSSSAQQLLLPLLFPPQWKRCSLPPDAVSSGQGHSQAASELPACAGLADWSGVQTVQRFQGPTVFFRLCMLS